MNDKELFNLLQEMKIILNNIKINIEENQKKICALKEDLDDLAIQFNSFLLEYKLFRLKVKFLNILSFGIYKKENKYDISLRDELLDNSLKKLDEEYKKVENEIHNLENINNENNIKIKCYSKNVEQMNSYFEVN